MSKRLLVRDQRGERERLLVGTMTVGRDTRCDISDADPLLSRRHAEFVCRPDLLIVRDLNSRNGISVNGVKVQEAVLRPGDVVKIARLVLTYLGDLDASRSAPPRSPADTGRPGAGDDVVGRFDAARTEKIEPPVSVGLAAPDADPRDDRTRVVPRRSPQGTSPPVQISVARMTPPVRGATAPPRSPAPSAELPAPGPSEADSDSTRPMIRDNESKTATPVLPLSALAAAEAASARPTAPVAPAGAAPPLLSVARHPAAPPVVVAPPVSAPRTADPLEEWSLELRPAEPDGRSPGPVQPPRASVSPGAHASRVAATTTSSPGVRALAGSLLLALVAFALGAAPLLVWRGRIADSYDRMQIVPAALTVGTAMMVFGPPLLLALCAGVLLGWWLRRG
jgi:hypothetical protein